jgi:hypothetical protein
MTYGSRAELADAIHEPLSSGNRKEAGEAS